ncbi:Ankyrin repeat-containing domain protein [Naviculisporaceae sp. PSN 640]
MPTGPIHLAALKGQYRILQILLDNGGEINGKDALGRTPLHCAVEGQKMDCVRLLVERGADVRILNNRGVSALHLAVEKGMEDAVVLFIEKGADPNRLAFYLTPELLSLCDELKKERAMSARIGWGRPRTTT